MNVWGSPTSFFASGATEILASTHFFDAEPELAPVPLVLRVSVTPPTRRDVDAITEVTPVALDVRSMVQLPFAFVEQEVLDTLPFDKLPGPDSIEKLTSTPEASAKPVPSCTLTCAVNVCV